MDTAWSIDFGCMQWEADYTEFLGSRSDKENKNHDRADPENDQKPLTDEEIITLLPNVSNSEFFIEPDQRGLTNMLQSDAKALRKLYGFTVGRRGFGKIRFLEPVNAERSDICDVFSFKKGESLDFNLRITRTIGMFLP